MKYSLGKKRKLSKDQEVELVDIITTHTPKEVSLKNRCNWTIVLFQDSIYKRNLILIYVIVQYMLL